MSFFGIIKVGGDDDGDDDDGTGGGEASSSKNANNAATGNNIADNNFLWSDVGDKKAREKATQCLRERNGVANKAVVSLVKTIMSAGEACPEYTPPVPI